MRDEIRRIRSGPAPKESATGIGLLTIRGVCRGNAVEVSARIREVLRIVIGSICQEPTAEEWLGRLPDWLNREFVPAMSEAESEQWLARWDGMSPEEKTAEERSATWALEDWLYWFQPAERQWEFWDCCTIGSDIVRLSIAVHGWPIPHAALDWLVRAAGAQDVFEEEPDM